MSDFPYLVGIALIEQEGERAMPIGGKSLKGPINIEDGPGEAGKDIALELLLRVFERSQAGFIKQSAGKESLLLLEIPIEAIQERLPLLKSEWLSTGNYENLSSNLKGFCKSIWLINFEKHKGIRFSRCS